MRDSRFAYQILIISVLNYYYHLQILLQIQIKFVDLCLVNKFTDNEMLINNININKRQMNSISVKLLLFTSILEFVDLRFIKE